MRFEFIEEFFEVDLVLDDNILDEDAKITWKSNGEEFERKAAEIAQREAEANAKINERMSSKEPPTSRGRS